jgi:tetratricopeptide (TPR) repeat protein
LKQVDHHILREGIMIRTRVRILTVFFGGLLWVSPLAAQKVSVEAKLEDLQAAALKDSNDAAAHYNLAMGYWSKKRYSEAEQSLRTAVKIEPQFAGAYLALGVVRNWDDDFMDKLVKSDTGLKRYFRETNGYYRKAFMLDPMVDIKILGSTYRWYGTSRFTKAFRDLVEGRYDKAYETLGKEVEFWGGRGGIDSAPTVVLWLHGLSAAHTQRTDVAITDIESLMKRVQMEADSATDVPLVNNEFRYMLAALRQASGQSDQAIALYQQVAENDIGHYMAHVQMARIYEGQKDYPHAVKERQNAINANPDDPSLVLDLGVTLGKAGMMPQAETRFLAAIEANPRDVRPLFWLGLAQMEQGKKEAAKESLNRFITSAPSRYERQITIARDRLTQLQ